MEKLNVAIADDNEKMLDLLENLINEDKELELVGHANNGADIYDIIKENYSTDGIPDNSLWNG